jgi:hypothetical protein
MTTDQHFAASEEADLVVDGRAQQRFNPIARIPSAVPAQYHSNLAPRENLRTQDFNSVPITHGKRCCGKFIVLS